MHWKDMPGGLDAFEKGLHERIMAYEREMLAEEMAAADVNTEAIKVAGTFYRRVLRCEGTYMTAAGPVQILRTLYKDRTDEAERAIVPMELRLGIVEGRWTPLAAQQAVWVVAQMTPKLAEELFRRIGNMTPSRSSLDRLLERDREAGGGLGRADRGTRGVKRDAGRVRTDARRSWRG
jgi:hypothetical protein